MSTDERPTESASTPSSKTLTAGDVKTYTTLANAGTVVGALAFLSLMWLPAVVLYLYFRRRDHAGLLRGHLAEASSLAIVLTVYAMLVKYTLLLVDADDFSLELLPVVTAAVAAYPCYLAVKAALRLVPHRHPKPLAWLPLD